MIDSTGPVYQNNYEDWEDSYDFWRGERAVSNAGTRYIRYPDGISTDAVRQNLYDSFKTLFNAYRRTIIGLTGSVMRKEPSVVLPDKVSDIVNYLTKDGDTLNELVGQLIQLHLRYGYTGILTDMDSEESKDNLPYFAVYAGPSIFKVRYKTNGRRRYIDLVTLLEIQYEPSESDPYTDEEVKYIRELALDDNGNYYQQLWKGISETGSDIPFVPSSVSTNASQNAVTYERFGEPIYPRINGKLMTEIPFEVVGEGISPMLDLLALNKRHFKLLTEAYYILNSLAPTWYFWGASLNVSDEGVKTFDFPIGPGACIQSARTAQECELGVAEPTGKGYTLIATELKALEERMAIVGARLLQQEKRQAETAEAMRLRVGADDSTLADVVNDISKALEGSFRHMLIMKKLPTDELSVYINKDFYSERLEANQITALLKAYQGNAISMETFLYNLKVGEALPENRSIEDEIALIEMQKEGFDFMPDSVTDVSSDQSEISEDIDDMTSDNGMEE